VDKTAGEYAALFRSGAGSGEPDLANRLADAANLDGSEENSARLTPTV
jgi:hypothetical protein